jgi:DNA-binding NtrC family response regulator
MPRLTESIPTSAARRTRAQDPFARPIVGAGARMRRIFRLVAKVAPTDSTVLLLGESGTGKELLARSIHIQSRRAGGPFVPVNIAAIPEALIESELFGYARGAFTDARNDRAGLLEEADHGTLFLDEIGDMPLSAQVKLLRMIESGEVRRLGDNATRLVDVRIVAATHRDLQALVEAGRFRQDLFYRLRVVQIDVPPLRDRPEDIGLLAEYFLARLSERQGRTGMEFAPATVDTLQRYDYPGNVRELENAIEHAVTLADGEVIGPGDLPLALRTPRMLGRGDGVAARASMPAAAAASVPAGATDDRDTWPLAAVERDHILRVLRRHQGNASAAARQLGVSRTTLWRKLREYGIRREDADGVR